MRKKVCKRAVLVVLALATSTVAGARPLSDVVRDKLEVPEGLGIVDIQGAGAEVAPETVALEAPREIHAGRQAIHVFVKGKAMWVQVAFGKIAHVAVAQHALAIGDVVAADDVGYEDRATATPMQSVDVVGARVVREIAEGAVVGKADVVLPPPVPRGTTVTIEARRGAVKIHGTGTLEMAARIGGSASVRMGAQVVHGTLLASNVVSVP